MSVWIQMSRLTWPIKVQAKAKISNCFSSVTLKDVPREFPPVRRNPLGKNWENLCQFSGCNWQEGGITSAHVRDLMGRAGANGLSTIQNFEKMAAFFVWCPVYGEKVEPHWKR